MVNIFIDDVFECSSPRGNTLETENSCHAFYNSTSFSEKNIHDWTDPLNSD